MLLLLVKILIGVSGSSKLQTQMVLVFCIRKWFCKHGTLSLQVLVVLDMCVSGSVTILCMLLVLLYTLVVLKAVCINGSVLLYECLLLLQIKVVLNLCILWVLAFYRRQYCNPFKCVCYDFIHGVKKFLCMRYSTVTFFISMKTDE